ncbi:MAG: xanthine dehydrogenase family protein molybdopterin-binding subunit [Betaproteobacteria bacterium]|nr:xanthine dehydrogenase family protein molybdopterin-binding subunit [Betaproteobacteria bacterium]
MSAHRTVGKRLARLDGVGKVTGAARYGVDQAMAGMLHGKLVRSPHPHARIRAIHVEKALAMPGVRGIVTAADVPAKRYGSFVKDMEVFASGHVLYVGQPVAGVAAGTLAQAERAAAAIEVEYEELPAVHDVEQALAPGAPLVHAGWQSYQAMPILKREGNVSNRARLVLGNVEEGFGRSARVFENRFVTSLVHPGYTEPRAALAAWDERGELVVWSNTQLPFEAQATLAEIFRVLPSRVRVVGTTIGGGFGGKLRLGVEHYVAVMARKTGRPVKMITTSEEELIAANPRQPVVVELKTGVAADGTILAHQGRILVDTGATSGSGVGVASSAHLMIAGPYRIPNVSLEGLSIYTNKTPTGSFRAPSGPQGNFAMESQMDIIAADLGIDPVDLRLRNALREGDMAANGQVVTSVSLEACLRQAAQAIGWHDRKPAPGRAKESHAAGGRRLRDLRACT